MKLKWSVQTHVYYFVSWDAPVSLQYCVSSSIFPDALTAQSISTALKQPSLYLCRLRI